MYCLQACLINYITVTAFRIYSQRGEDAAKRGDWRPCIKSVMEITLLIVENHGKTMELCFRISVGTLLSLLSRCARRDNILILYRSM